MWNEFFRNVGGGFYMSIPGRPKARKIKKCSIDQRQQTETLIWEKEEEEKEVVEEGVPMLPRIVNSEKLG
jgi:hypothetical protein